MELVVKQQIKVNKIHFFFTFFANMLISIDLIFDNNYHYNVKKSLFYGKRADNQHKFHNFNWFVYLNIKKITSFNYLLEKKKTLLFSSKFVHNNYNFNVGKALK